MKYERDIDVESAMDVGGTSQALAFDSLNCTDVDEHSHAMCPNHVSLENHRVDS